MPNLMQSGASWLAGKLQSSAGVSVVYHRGATQSGTITATPSQHEYDVIGTDDMLTSVLSYDWTFTAADIAISGSAIQPRPGDRIVASVNGVSQTYEVSPMKPKPCFERLDTSGILLFVHSKLVA